MTGEEFLNKVRAIKTITDVHWQVKGDVLDPDEVKVVIIADGEKIELDYPRPGQDNFFQHASMALIINKFMEQIGNDFRTNVYDDMASAVNHSREQIQRGGKEND